MLLPPHHVIETIQHRIHSDYFSEQRQQVRDQKWWEFILMDTYQWTFERPTSYLIAGYVQRNEPGPTKLLTKRNFRFISSIEDSAARPPTEKSCNNETSHLFRRRGNCNLSASFRAAGMLEKKTYPQAVVGTPDYLDRAQQHSKAVIILRGFDKW